MKKSALLGSFVASLFSSSCCMGPLLFSFFGRPAPEFTLVLGNWRVIFIGIALLFLAWAFFDCYARGFTRRWTKQDQRALWLTLGIDLLFIVSSRLIALFI